MDTELLNEYLFADLVAEWSVRVRTERLTAMKAGGLVHASEPDSNLFTSSDLREGLKRLEAVRLVVRGLPRATP